MDTRWDAVGEKEPQIRECVAAMAADSKIAVKAVVSEELPAKVKDIEEERYA